MEKGIIIGFFQSEEKEPRINLMLDELKALAESAGAEILKTFWQKRRIPDKKYFVGRGKIQEIKNDIIFPTADLIIFLNELSNMQQRNLENFFKIKVIDRNRLILDIFATRAKSREGKLQVELAQLLYLLPRLTGRGVELSRLGGGIGTRGPGETKLEVDRRSINKRISVIKRRLKTVIKNRRMQRKSRRAYPVPVVSLVGYTSAGKSTLFRTLTGQDVFISRQLFSTLDPLLRKVDLKDIEPGYYFLLSDTVGFIRDMPEELLTAFRATLEELTQSDIILHIVDLSNPDYINQKRDVEHVLKELEVSDQKIITVYNKIDLFNHLEFQSKNNDNEVSISAIANLGILNLKQAIFNRYFKNFERYTITLSDSRVNIDSIRRWAIIVKKDRMDHQIQLEILCSREKMIQFKQKFGELTR